MARRKDGPVEVVRPKAAFSASERPLNVSVSLHDLAGRACRQVWEAVQDPDDFVAARMLAKTKGKGRADVSEQGKNGNPLVDGMTRSFPWIALSPKDSLSDDDQPDWIKQCRARVVDMAAGDVVVSPKDVANSLPPRLESRVAVASQDGSVWIFRKHASDNQQSRRVSFDGQHSPRSTSSSPSATPPIPSTPASRSARSRPLKVRTVSSSSISLCPTSPTLQETSFRPQKASATVGLSTSDTASLPTESFTATHITSPSISSIHDHITNPHVSAPSNQSSPKNPSSGSAPKLEVSLSGQEGSPSSPLEPLVRLTTATNDLNVAILVTNATRYAMLEANVIVALTKRGALSVHSLLDGRCLERKTLPRAHYHSMQVLTLEKTVVLACHSHSATRIVDSNSLLELANVELGACVSSVALEDGPGLAVYALHKDRLQKYAITRKDDQSVASRLVSFLPFDDHDADQDDGSAHADEVEDEDYWRGLCAVGSRVAAFNDDSIIVFEDKSNKIEVMARASFPSCQKLQSCTSTSFIAVSDHSVSLLVLQISSTKSTIVKARSLALEGVEALALMEADQAAPSLLVARATDTARDLHLCTLSGSEASTSVVFNAPVPQTFRHRPALFVQSKAGTYIIGTTDGEIYESQLSKIDISKDPIDQLCGCITFMCLHTLGDAEVLIVGCADGVAAAWYTKDWQRLGSWTLFASPVVNAVPFEDMDGAPTFVFVSANSPTALVSLFPPKMHFILPGTKSAPELIATFNGEVLILYEHGLARICHLESRELRRSMDRKTAEGVLAQSAWRVWYNSKEVQQQDPTFLALTKDVRALLDEANRSLPWKEKTNGADTPVNGHNSGTDVEFKAQKSRQLKMNGTMTKSQVDSFIRFALSHLLDFSLSSSMNEIAFEHLNISPPTQRLRFGLTSDLVVPPFAFDSSGWTISGVVTAHRLLKIICLLRAYLNFPHTERHATQLIVYYASEIADAVGGKFQPPCLVTLSEYWLDRSPEVQAAVQVLFGAYLLSLSDNEVRALVDDWSTMLPCREKGSSPHHGTADQALLLIGLVAVEKYSLLSSSLLKDVANSIVQFMDDFDEPHHQAIAVELSSRGFHIWQNYVDAMSLARQLFTLATGQDARPPADLRAQAKLASLHLSSTNTPLFITTLSFDILNAKSAESRKATMKLLGLMARKKPLVLYSNLPKLAEVVVKSLDPTVSALRETVHQAATVILNELVRTYPSIDFHGKSQRLAVGTHEGAAIVYDLKTGTRLYVLEGHKKPVTALSWSPDGRRLVSVSLDEGRAVVWKVGVGIFSMFTPGAPPRQSSALAAVSSGSSSSAAGTPYKVIDFNVGDEALMTTAATLEWVAFEWPAERTARLRIRETSLTFPVS